MNIPLLHRLYNESRLKLWILLLVGTTLQETQKTLARPDVTLRRPFIDPYYYKQWYTISTQVDSLNLMSAYRMGVSGMGVTVAIVGVGVDHTHPDLATNYVLELSYDACSGETGAMPHGSEYHGTECAGVIGMSANNSECGVGVAYNCNIAGVKWWCEDNHVYVEPPLAHNYEYFDIYSNAWGPVREKGTLMRPHNVSTDQALLTGITKGRKGKGAIYVFSAGNSRGEGNTCAANSYVNHYATIPIAAASRDGKVAKYSERCSAIFATSYSDTIVTTTNYGGCISHFGGTSAAAAVASGVFALVLEANPNLTYRDVMHIISMGAEVAPLAMNANSWYQNAKGFWVSNDFGFGMLNAGNMVALAKTWKNVPKRNKCVVSVSMSPARTLTLGMVQEINIETTACEGTADVVKYLEHVEVACSISCKYRGSLSIYVTTPSGTKTTLMEPRLWDKDGSGLNNWNIKSVHAWGEKARGTWTIHVLAKWRRETGFTGYVHGFTLSLHGTADQPAHYKSLPRAYTPFTLSDGTIGGG